MIEWVFWSLESLFQSQYGMWVMHEFMHANSLHSLALSSSLEAIGNWGLGLKLSTMGAPSNWNLRVEEPCMSLWEG